jgi:hypothetical protein
MHAATSPKYSVYHVKVGIRQRRKRKERGKGGINFS